jgi:hypothetical protein
VDVDVDEDEDEDEDVDVVGGERGSSMTRHKSRRRATT